MYCFINCVYTDKDDNSQAYELVKSSQDFNNVERVLVDLDGLKAYAANDAYIKDFCIADGYLQCPSAKRYPINQVIRESLEQHTVFKNPQCDFNLYSLLKLGVENGFKFILEEYAEKDEHVGGGVTPFYCLRNSQSSMSLYYRYYTETEFGNVYLIQSKNNNLVFEPFYFLVPVEYEEKIPCDFVKSIKVNNVMYKMYYTGTLDLIEPMDIIPLALINKACCLRVRLKTVIDMVKEYSSAFYDRDSEKVWVDNGYHDHSVSHVILESSLKQASNKTICDGVTYVSGYVAEQKKAGKTNDDIIAGIKELQIDSSLKYAYLWIAFIILNSDNVAEVLSNCNEVYKRMSVSLFNADIFLYKVKALLCLTGLKLVESSDPFICGSDEIGLTIVKEVSHGEFKR